VKRARADHTPRVSGIAIAGNAWYLPGRIFRNQSMNRGLIVIGSVVVLIGVFLRQFSALPFFRLPGDIVIDRPGMKVFLPITTMIVISVVLSLIAWLFRR